MKLTQEEKDRLDKLWKEYARPTFIEFVEEHLGYDAESGDPPDCYKSGNAMFICPSCVYQGSC